MKINLLYPVDDMLKSTNLSELTTGVFPKRNGIFSEFSKFRESDKSLKHELVSIKDLTSALVLLR